MSAAPITGVEQPQTTPMGLLASGVPLSLLLDLVCGPRSADLLREEAGRVPQQRLEAR